ncbi:phage tail tape measure protein [Weeksella virosa]|uniref:phage tail tape measure protein n=1 Tax=Weeksella virosa TaxID=1014 RepID=UPI0025570F5B|nr:phage tail tape measure protein [Weeksella virosa]MDK7374527.1 phage tail tape measure protein [Weeksella virosa]
MARNQTTKLTITINGKEVERSLSGMGKELKELNKEVQRMNEGDPNFRQKSADLAKLRQEYNRLREEVYGANNATSNFTSGLKGVAAGIAAAFTIDKVVQFGQQVYEISEKMTKLNMQISQLTGMTGHDLADVTVSTQSISDVYSKNSEEIMKAAHAFSILTGDYAESISFIKDGFRDGLDLSGQFLTNIQKYSPIIKEAGGDAQDLMNILRAGTQDGVFNDKSIEAVKQFTQRVREMTPATQKAFDQIGISSKQVIEDLRAGNRTIMDVMDEVSIRLSEMNSTSKETGVAMAKMFGQAGKEAGYDFLSTLHSVNKAQKSLTAEQEEWNRVTDKQMASAESWNRIWMNLTGTTGILTEAIIDAKQASADFVSFLFDIKELRASDELFEQEVALKLLKRELNDTNISQQRRNELLEEIQRIYPSFFLNLDKEKASNKELSAAIDGVTESLSKRRAVAIAEEELQDTKDRAQKAIEEQEQAEAKLLKMILELSTKYKVEIPVELESKSLFEQATWLRNQIKGETKMFSWDLSDLNTAILNLGVAKSGTESWRKELDRVEQSTKRIKENFTDIRAEAVRSFNDVNNAIVQHFVALGQEKSKNNKSISLAPSPTGRSTSNRSGVDSAARAKEQERKRREQINEEIIRAENDFRKRLSQVIVNYDQEDAELLMEGLEKDLAIIEAGLAQRKNTIANEIADIEFLQQTYRKKADFEASKGNSDAAKKFKDLADEQVRIIAYKNSTINYLEEKANLDRLKAISKAKTKEIELRQKNNDAIIRAAQAENNEELASVSTLEEARLLLQEKYGVENLKQFETIADAKRELAKQQQKQLLDEQLGQLEVEMAEIKKMLDDDSFARENGLSQILTDEDRDRLIDNMRAVGMAISEVKLSTSDINSDDADKAANREKNARKQILSGIDLLAFSADDWAEAFEALNKAGSEMEMFAAKIKLVEMSIQSVASAWSMMADAQAKAMDRKLKALEKNTDREKKVLQKQLDEGYISQEEYNAKIEELEIKLQTRRADMAYKQAMNEWEMNLVMAQANTALGVTKALTMKPPYSYILAGITGALGLVQQGIIMSNKPKRNLYAKGGFTEGLGYYDETGEEVAGDVHAGEYVVPKWMNAIPVVANIVDFLEGIRTGGSPKSNPTDKYAEGGKVEPKPTATNNDTSMQELFFELMTFLDKGNQLLEDLIVNGVRLPRTMETTKMLSEDIEAYKSLMNKRRK